MSVNDNEKPSGVVLDAVLTADGDFDWVKVSVWPSGSVVLCDEHGDNCVALSGRQFNRLQVLVKAAREMMSC